LLSGLLGLMSIPFSHRAGNLHVIVKFLAIVSATIVFVYLFKFPYDESHPQRIFVQHTHVLSSNSRKFDSLSGDESFLLFAAPDATGMSAQYLINNGIDANLLQNPKPYDGLLYWDSYYPFSYILQGSGFRVDVPPSAECTPPSLTILSDEYDDREDLRKIHVSFNYSGSEWSTFRCSDTLQSWSVTDKLPPHSPVADDPGYLIRHVGGYGISEWRIHLAFRGKGMVRFDISTTHFVETTEAQKLTSQLPKWTTAVSALTVCSKWEL